jgi:ribulose-phosphate 3-epimerase
MAVKISPSLAAAPFDRLGEVVLELDRAGVDYIHIDIEDGSFVPVMTLGTKLITDLRSYTKLPFDVHLMMNNPEWILPELVENGADRLSVHLEACRYPRRTLGMIHRLGAVPGIAINPKTQIKELGYLAPFLKFVVLLTTEPEGADCPFLPKILNKIRTGKKIAGMGNVEWVVDGGVNQDNLAQVVAAGADTVVVGRSAFLGDTLTANIQQMRKIILEASE